MPPLKPGTLIIEFVAAPSARGAWPAAWYAHLKGSVEEAKLAAKSTLDQNTTFPLAVGFKVLDHEGKELYTSPEAK